MASVESKLPVARIKFKGLFDYDRLMRDVRNWLIENSYEFNENSYKHKIPTPLGYEQEVTWTAWRKVTGYVKYHIHIFFHFYEMNDVEVIKNNQRVKMAQGRFFIELKSRVELDYSDFYGKNAFLVGLRDWIHRYLIFHKIHGGWEDELYYRVYKLHLVMKESIGMSTLANASRYRY